MARRIAVEIVGDSASLERAFKRSAEGARGFNRQVETAGKGGSVFGGLTHSVAGMALGFAGVGGLAEAAKTAFDRMQEGQKTAAQTAAVLQSTHGVANVTTEDINKLADSLLNKTGIDNETIKSGENLLLTFTNIRNEVGKGNDIFNQATTTILNMSTALGEDTKSAAIQLGKALNDPVKGMTALRRVGVQFTTDQQSAIKAMVKTGNTMGAQKLILKELTKEFGGSAAAAGKTLPGQLNILKTHLLNLAGTIATQFTPQITKTIQAFIAWISQAKNQKAIMDVVRGAVDALKTAVGILRGAFQILSGVLGGNKQAIEFLIGAYAGFKILTIASRLATMAASFGLVTVAEGEATAATTGLSIALGPTVLVAGALAAGVALGTLIYQLPIVKQLADEAANSIASLFGYTDPMAKYAGTTAPTQAQGSAILAQAKQLEAGGRMSPSQAASALGQRFPTVAPADLQKFAQIAATELISGRPPANVHVTFNGITDTSDMQKKIDQAIAQHYGRVRRGT